MAFLLKYPGRILLALTFVVVLIITAVLGMYWVRAHQQMDALTPRLPSLKSIRQSARIDNLPTSIKAFNSASQLVPMRLVLDRGGDEKFVMSFPFFVVEWADGKQFLIDAGLTKESAKVFGQQLKYLGAEKMIFESELATQLDLSKINGVGFTHLHSDHVDGIYSICKYTDRVLLVQSYEQFERGDYLTSSQDEKIDALPCLKRFLIRDNFLMKSISGFPGLYIVYVAGHTPGSQVFIIHTKSENGFMTYVIAGDVVNHARGIVQNIPKPSWYSRFVVPENSLQLKRTRAWLKTLSDQYNIKVVTSHHKQNVADNIGW